MKNDNYIDRSTGKPKLIVNSVVYEHIKKLFGKEYADEKYIKEQEVKKDK